VTPKTYSIVRNTAIVRCAVPHLPQPVLENRLDEWRRLLRMSPTQGRAVIQRIVRGCIIFTPEWRLHL
jgi:hypothetical protein